MKEDRLEKLLGVSRALSAERDREKLLAMILDTAIELANCDAGTLYLKEETGLAFKRMVTLSQNVRLGGHDGPITLPSVPLSENYVCALSALRSETVCIDDVRLDKRFDFSGPLRYDEMTGYRTQSMLVVPMTDDRGETIGVTQLINAKNARGETVPFDGALIPIISALSSQAAICIANMRYAEQVKDLLDSLVAALSAAIDERTPYNANHTRNMVSYASRFLDRLNDTSSPYAFDELRRRSFLLAVGLHDVGKLAVPLEVMDKETRLGQALSPMLERLKYISLALRLDLAEGRITAEERERRERALCSTRELVLRINGSGFLSDEDEEELKSLAKEKYLSPDGETLPFVTEREYSCLSIKRGTLTADERKIMESHAAATGRILSHVTFPHEYASVPLWAASHHERLDGRGYPKGLTARDIPFETRLLTVLDVFEALTAKDRPYKAPMPAEKALSILHGMADGGAVDGDVLSLFEKTLFSDKKNEREEKI